MLKKVISLCLVFAFDRVPAARAQKTFFKSLEKARRWAAPTLDDFKRTGS
jgi:hypothetical protein